MKKRLLPGVFLVAAAACSTGAPTEAERTAGSGAMLDGGVMHGSGNRSDTTTANTTAAAPGEATASEADGAGVMHGSGN
jgi:hypothetical protein